MALNSLGLDVVSLLKRDVGFLEGWHFQEIWPGRSGPEYGQFGTGLNLANVRIASSRKYGPGLSGPGYGQCDRGVRFFER